MTYGTARSSRRRQTGWFGLRERLARCHALRWRGAPPRTRSPPWTRLRRIRRWWPGRGAASSLRSTGCGFSRSISVAGLPGLSFGTGRTCESRRPARGNRRRPAGVQRAEPGAHRVTPGVRLTASRGPQDTWNPKTTTSAHPAPNVPRPRRPPVTDPVWGQALVHARHWCILTCPQAACRSKRVRPSRAAPPALRHPTL